MWRLHRFSPTTIGPAGPTGTPLTTTTTTSTTAMSAPAQVLAIAGPAGSGSGVAAARLLATDQDACLALCRSAISGLTPGSMCQRCCHGQGQDHPVPGTPYGAPWTPWSPTQALAGLLGTLGLHSSGQLAWPAKPVAPSAHAPLAPVSPSGCAGLRDRLALELNLTQPHPVTVAGGIDRIEHLGDVARPALGLAEPAAWH